MKHECVAKYRRIGDLKVFFSIGVIGEDAQTVNWTISEETFGESQSALRVTFESSRIGRAHV